MARTRDYSRDARVLELTSAVLGVLWILAALAGLGWITAALVGKASWMIGIALLLGATFLRAVNRQSNRLVQESIRKGMWEGTIRIGQGGLARRSSPEERTHSHAGLTDALPWADEVVTSYASILEQSRSSPLIAESSLPAAKTVVKEALLIAAAVRRGGDALTDEELALYRQAFGALVNVAPDDRVREHAAAMDTINQAGGVDNLSADELRRAARHVGNTVRDIDAEAMKREGVALLAEFDSRLIQLLTVYRGGAT